LEPLEPRELLATTPIVQYVIRTLEPGTDTPINSILAGRDFDLEVLAQDLRNDGDPSRGVYAAFLDVLYDESLAKVRVAEVQRISFFGDLTGTFSLSFNGQTTDPIIYDVNTPQGAAALPAKLENALNKILGPGSVKVTPDADTFLIHFIGQYDVDEPMLQSSDPNILVTEVVKGDPSVPKSFTEAFRSYDLGLGDDLPSPYQISLSANNAPDRIDELGAQVGLTATHNVLTEVVRGRVKALMPGNQSSQNLVFTPDFSQITSPIHDTLVFADINATPAEKSYVSPDQIAALPVSLTINAALVSAPVAASLDEDNTAGVIISVLPSVVKNPAAPSGVVELRSITQPAGGVVTILDPNNTPHDFSDDILEFVPAPNFFGTTTFTYQAGIAGDTNSFDTTSNTVTVTVNPVNDAPTNNVPGPQSMFEDGSLAFSAAGGNPVSISDIDADPTGVKVTLQASVGTIAVAPVSGINFTTGQPAGGTTLVFSGTTSAVNAALAGLTFKPSQDFNGPVTITLTTDDQGNTGKPIGVSLKATSTIAINVAPVNDAPVLQVPSVTQSVYTANSLAFSPSFNNAITVSDVDAGSDPMSVSITASDGLGTLAVADISGAQIGGNGNASLSITGSQSAINLTLSTLVLTPGKIAANGFLIVLANDQQLNPGPALTDQKQIAVNVSVTTNPFGVNDAPLGLTEGQASYIIDVLANDLTNDPAKPTLVSFTQPTRGTLTRFNTQNPPDLTDGRLIYIPPLTPASQLDLDFFTPASAPPVAFTYVMDETPSIGLPQSPPATVTLRIANVPDLPVAVSPLYATSVGIPLTLTAAQGLTVGATDVDNNYGDPTEAKLTVTGATASTPLLVQTTGGGTASVNADGSFTYSPLPGFQGDDTFDFRIHSSLGPDSNPATVKIHVSPPPTASDDSFNAQEDQPFNSPASVLANDNDNFDHETLSAVLITNVPAFTGSVALSSDGNFTYTPAANFNTTRPPSAPIFFTYQAVVPSGRQTAVATAFITVNEVNDNPVAVNDSFRAARNNGILGSDQLINVLGNDSFAPDVQETLSVIGLNGTAADSSGNLASLPTNAGGSVRLVNGHVLYTSPTNTGDDPFTYILSDGRGGTATGTVSVHVAPLYDYGDAPDSYGTLFASDGPRHLATGPQLGLLRDEELDASPNNTATGDDTIGSADEDGLVSYSVTPNAQSTIALQVVANNVVPKLDAWIDFNHDGTFTADEKISDSASIAAGTSSISFIPPATTPLGPTFARFRLSTAGGLGPTGLLPNGSVPDGEVEDYVINVSQDLVVDLSNAPSGSQISIRKNGNNVEVFDVANNTALQSSPLASTHAIIIHGSATQPDQMKVDYAFGGFFSVPGGIQLDGGAGGGDSLTIQGASGRTTSAVYISQGQSLGNAAVQTTDSGVQNNIVFTNFEPLSFSGINSFSVQGMLPIGGDQLDLGGATNVNLGTTINLNGGTLKLPAGVSLAAGETLQGTGVIVGPINAAAGSVIKATGSLTLGDPNSTTGFVTHGELDTGGNLVTLLSAGPVILGSLTTLGAQGIAGTISAPSGIALDANNVISGYGTLDTPNDPNKPLINNGSIQGTSDAQPITLLGYVKGLGALDHVLINGTLSPGLSPAMVNYGSVSLGTLSTLILELGGKAAGSFDQINFTGNLNLGGTLQISLINGYFPDFNDSFNLLVGASLSNAFSSINLPALNSDLKWQTTPGSSQFIAAAVTTHPWYNRSRPHDVDNDHHITAADVLNIINYINAQPHGSDGKVPANAVEGKIFRDVDKDNFVTASDIISVINYINARSKLEDDPPPTGQSLALASTSSFNDTLNLIAADIADSTTKKK
jgi:hypothetical protein